MCIDDTSFAVAEVWVENKKYDSYNLYALPSFSLYSWKLQLPLTFRIVKLQHTVHAWSGRNVLVIILFYTDGAAPTFRH